MLSRNAMLLSFIIYCAPWHGISSTYVLALSKHVINQQSRSVVFDTPAVSRLNGFIWRHRRPPNTAAEMNAASPRYLFDELHRTICRLDAAPCERRQHVSIMRLLDRCREIYFDIGFASSMTRACHILYCTARTSAVSFIIAIFRSADAAYAGSFVFRNEHYY